MGARPSTPRRSLVTVLALVGASFGALLVATPRASAITYVSGPLSADATWGTTETQYVLYDHVTVLPGVTLNIVQGTTVRMDPGVALFVEGRLIAQGFPGNEVAFRANNSMNLIPPQGIQFNASSTGSVDRALFLDRFERPVTAIDSSPWIGSNYVESAVYGFYLVRSNYWVWGNVIDRAVVGIFASQSNANIQFNLVNGTGTGIEVADGGAPTVLDNTITNTSGPLAIGIHVTSGADADLWRNAVYGVQGMRGGNGVALGQPGEDGGLAVGIVVDSAATATIRENAVGAVYGGRGGDGAPLLGGTGGRGGHGGPAGGIVAGGVGVLDADDNVVGTIVGGRGGQGGGGGGTATGGDGGNGGVAAGLEVLGASGPASYYTNTIDGIAGGAGGNGGDGTLPDGNGGKGGEAYGILTIAATDGDASANSVQNIMGGPGGNSTTGAGNAAGAAGGPATGIAVTLAAGASILHSNGVVTVAGGEGGRGGLGGDGGSATGISMIAAPDGNFNATSATSNWVQDVAGGGGGPGARQGGDAGSASGIATGLVTPFLGGNTVWNLLGGAGGDALDGTEGGRGGDASGVFAFVVSNGWSAADTVFDVTRGLPGTGPPVQPSYGSGHVVVGDPMYTASHTIENGTIFAIGDRDLWVSSYAEGVTINTAFDAGSIMVEPAGNLTVKNYLGVELYWPDGSTPVAGANMLVEEDGTPVYDFPSATGQDYWLLVTDRVYPESVVAQDVQNDVTVTYLAYNFLNSPRTVDMAASNTQTFVMIDEEAPVSTASALPMYTLVSAFPVYYNASDGSGTGLQDITLYYRKDGAGWTPFATQPAAPSGWFDFVTVGDGTYEFATIATDWASNVEPGPNANETWTVVDTVRPDSSVAALPAWTTIASFSVSWGPEPGVTDIATYTVQYDGGAGWTDWLGGTILTTAVFTSFGDGLYQFRSVATDAAGNVELVTGNDTWTYVDTQLPVSAVAPLPPFTATLTFTVSWGPEPGTMDVVSYRIEANDDGGGWSPWIASTPSTSASFTGLEGHTYEFRSIATDVAGNVEPTPVGNDTWTHVDTILPGSRVDALAPWQTSLAFPVTWGPDPGITDIARYTVQYNRGFGWTNWLVDTTQTGATFTATTNALYQFRSIATDTSGNVEVVAGNDTWTYVDTVKPWTFVEELAPWQTTLTFPVSWAPEADDVASYRIQVRDDGAPWADWIPFTTARSADFTGLDDHTYEFRSIGTDYAGNVQVPNPGNDTWTRIDATPPDSAVLSLPTWETTLTFGLSWGPVAPTADIVTYTLESSDAGGPWTPVPGYVDTTLTSGSFTGLDGRSYGFRTIARDRAGNAEVAPSGNDTWTTVDGSPPATVSSLAGTMGSAQWYVTAVTVSLSATDATSGVASIMVRVDNGSWQAYGATVVVTGDGNHVVAFHATDAAGVTETAKVVGFRIDTTPPATAADLTGTLGDNGWHISSVAVSLTSTDPASGVASVAYRLDGGAWSTYATPLSVTADGDHAVEFYGTDAAGLAETAKTVAFRIDATDPLVVTTAPRGAGTNTTPVITVTFSEGMNRASVEGAFTISPDINGAFAWSADNRTVTFVADRELQAGTTYFVAIGTSAKDGAGNILPQTVTFSFETASPVPTVTGSGDWLWIIAVIAAALGGVAFVALRRLGARAKPAVPAAAEKEGQATIDDVFLLYRDGILIKHETRRLKPDIDTDILSGMLTAVQSFVKDSFRSEDGELDEMTFGEMHILIGRGKWVILAAMVQGDGTVAMRAQIERCIAEMEAQRPQELESWDGNMTIAKVLSPFIKKLIRGEYA